MPTPPVSATQKTSAAQTISLFSHPVMKPSVTTIATKLMGDQSFRTAFLANPTQALQQEGIPIGTTINLTARDKLVLQLIGDQSVENLYKSGNIAGLQQYIAANYAGLAVGGATREDAAADFDVVIETEVVAVAEVAVVAIAVADIVASQVNQVVDPATSVANARIAALEARVQLLESQLAQAGLAASGGGAVE